MTGQVFKRDYDTCKGERGKTERGEQTVKSQVAVGEVADGRERRFATLEIWRSGSNRIWKGSPEPLIRRWNGKTRGKASGRGMDTYGGDEGEVRKQEERQQKKGARVCTSFMPPKVPLMFDDAVPKASYFE